MEFRGPNHVYECIPPVLDIRTQWEEYRAKKAAGEKVEELKPVIIGLKCIPTVEVDEDVFKEVKIRAEKSPEEAQRIVSVITRDRIRTKVAYIKNLVIDDEEITEFDRFYEVAPPELVSWVCKVVYSSYILSRTEIKN